MAFVFWAVGIVSLLVCMWLNVAALADARRYLPLEFRDELSLRYYMARAFFDPSIPWPVRRRLLISAALGILGFLCFGAAAAVQGHALLAALFLLGGGFAVVNVVLQRPSART